MLIPKPCAGPRPILRIEHQLRLCRIILNVVNGLAFVFAVSHEYIKIILSPERALFSEQFVRKPSRMFFPRANDLRHWHSSHFEQDMDMVRHHYPRPQLITGSRKSTKVILDQLRQISAAQLTLTSPFVQVCLQFSLPLMVVFNLEKVHPLGAKRFRKAIRETKRYELSEPRLVAVRQITTLMPTSKTLLGIIWVWRRRPTTLALYQLAKAGIVRWPRTTTIVGLIHEGY